MCCRMPLKKVEVDGGERHYCLKCNHETPPLEIINETTIAIKLKVLKDISENDKALAQLILDLRDGKTCRGLSDFPPPSPSVNSLPPIDPRRFSKEEMLGFKTMEFMSPQDREKVVKKVEWLLVQHKLKELEDRGILPPEEPKAEKK